MRRCCEPQRENAKESREAAHLSQRAEVRLPLLSETIAAEEGCRVVKA